MPGRIRPSEKMVRPAKSARRFPQSLVIIAHYTPFQINKQRPRHEPNPITRHHRPAAGFTPARHQAVAATGRRTARFSAGIGGQNRRPFRQQPRRGGADRGAALCVPHARRPSGVGRGSPKLSAQNPHRPQKPHGHHAQIRRAGGLSQTRRIGIRRFRRGALFHFYRRGAGHGGGRQTGRQNQPQRGGNRRRRDDRRPSLRSPQLRRRYGYRSLGDSERQRNVDFTQCRRAAQISGAQRGARYARPALHHQGTIDQSARQTARRARNRPKSRTQNQSHRRRSRTRQAVAIAV